MAAQSRIDRNGSLVHELDRPRSSTVLILDLSPHVVPTYRDGVRGYGQYCPLAKASEIVAERWTPLVLRELVFGERTFNDIQRGVPLMSRSLLSKRLRELERAGVVERRPGRRGHEYHLTEAGRELEPVLVGLATWGTRWTHADLRPDEMDPRPLMWDIHRRIEVHDLPDERVVVQFVWRDVMKAPLRRAWLVCDRPDVEVCYKDPGHPVDLVVTAKLRAMVDVWLGATPMRRALENDDIRIDGPGKLARAFPRWLKLSVVADVPRPVTAR